MLNKLHFQPGRAQRMLVADQIIPQPQEVWLAASPLTPTKVDYLELSSVAKSDLGAALFGSSHCPPRLSSDVRIICTGRSVVNTAVEQLPQIGHAKGHREGGVAPAIALSEQVQLCTGVWSFAAHDHPHAPRGSRPASRPASGRSARRPAPTGRGRRRCRSPRTTLGAASRG